VSTGDSTGGPGAAGGASTGRLRLALSPEEAGTLLGACAWVLGALEILKDRGHSQDEEELHELHDELAPAVSRLAALVGDARAAAVEDPATQATIEEAFGGVRDAFERWVRLTAADTMALALEQRLEELDASTRSANGGAAPPAPAPADDTADTSDAAEGDA
jgi:hypothetical protein